jgi:protoporphyrin/coproporphyrin ferrochelatase
MAMRYSNPGIESVLSKVVSENPQKISLCSMYPQFALSSNETAKQECCRVLRKLQYKGEVSWLRPFHSEPEFIEAFATRAREILPESLDEKILC